jgi:hypothetical protein
MKLIAVLLLLLNANPILAQESASGLRFRSAHLDLTGFNKTVAARLNIDIDVARSELLMSEIGARTGVILMKESSYDIIQRLNGYYFAPLLTARSKHLILNLYFGTILADVKDDKGFQLYTTAGMDIKVMIFPEVLGIILHASTEKIGAGLTLGYLRM